jgi:hypothetical protein
MKTVTVLEGQTIWDIAMQEYGNHLCVFTLRDDNLFAIQDLNASIPSGYTLKIRTDLGTVIGARFKIAKHYADNGIKVISNAL